MRSCPSVQKLLALADRLERQRLLRELFGLASTGPRARLTC
jgi:hypothetical protein